MASISPRVALLRALIVAAADDRAVADQHRADRQAALVEAFLCQNKGFVHEFVVVVHRLLLS